MAREVIRTDGAPRALGPYSQGIATGSTLYCAGQIGLDPSSGTLVPGGIEAETRRALENLRAVVHGAGSRLSAVLKTTVFLADMGEFEAMNRVYAEFFPEAPPARSTVQVSRLPKDARVEIEAIVSI